MSSPPKVDGENWLDDVKCPEMYMVSDHGRFWSKRRSKIMAANSKNRDGYRYVSLYIDGKYKPRYIHRAVLEAFRPERPERYLARHLNGDPSDNRLVNLEWSSNQQNMLDRTRHGTDKNSNVRLCPRGHDLVRKNLVPSMAIKGFRSCLACSRAKPHAKYKFGKGYIDHPEYKKMADARYVAIMAEPDDYVEPGEWSPSVSVDDGEVSVRLREGQAHSDARVGNNLLVEFDRYGNILSLKAVEDLV